MANKLILSSFNQLRNLYAETENKDIHDALDVVYQEESEGLSHIITIEHNIGDLHSVMTISSYRDSVTSEDNLVRERVSIISNIGIVWTQTQSSVPTAEHD